MRMAPFFQAGTAGTVRVLQSLLLPGMESGEGPRLVAKDFGKDAASLAFSYCPEVVMPDARRL
jgi:hypothetical protein